MLSRKVLLPISAAAFVACLWLPATGRGQTIPNQPVWFTFSNEVALPGITLQPGQYEFKLSTSKSDRNIVEVYSKDTGKRVTTVLAVQVARSDAQPVPEKPEVRFFEVPAGTPPAVRSWWYPGIRGGHELLYPRAQAQTLAKMNKEGVMTTDGDLESGKLARMSAPPEPARPTPEPMPLPEAAPSPTPAPMPSPEPMAPGMNMQAQAADGSSARTELPRTATEAPLLLAIGLGAFFAGLALVVRRRRA